MQTTIPVEIWRELEIGTCSCKCALFKALDGYTLDPRIKKGFDDGTYLFTPAKKLVQLANFTLKEMGFERGMYPEICTWGKEMGFSPCPDDLGLYLRQKYADQPDGDILIMVSNTCKGESWNSEGKLPQALVRGRVCLFPNIYGIGQFTGPARFVFVVPRPREKPEDWLIQEADFRNSTMPIIGIGE